MHRNVKKIKIIEEEEAGWVGGWGGIGKVHTFTL